MRLLYSINDEELGWTKDLGSDDKLPPYAILSHTWQDDQEVTYDDLVHSKGMDKAGFEKIRFCAREAERDGLQHFWVDTCCIDKSNQIELQSAINSMFRWYQNASECYVYLSDVSLAKTKECDNGPDFAWMPAFWKSRWFTRGWTLQELLAPCSVKFFSREGQFLGDKNTLQRQIHQITGIPVAALQGTSLREFSIEERMSWTERRQTKYKEDKVYSLLGIFGIFMLPNYGEGEENAFKRLQKELKESPAELTGASTAGNVHWVVPRMVNSLFTGRVELIDSIRSAFRADESQNMSKQKRLVITGIGGQGKSELCLRVATSMQEEFWGVFWVDVGSQSTAKNGFMAVAKALGSSAETVDESLHALANTKRRWLLVLDNADDPAFDYAAYIPSGTRGAILMTSRIPQCSRYSTVKAIELEGLTMEHSSELLLKAAQVPEEKWTYYKAQAQDIVQLLGSHTLALIQAGAYIAEGHCRLGQYPEKYQQQRKQLLKHHPGQEQSRYRDVYATFEASAAVLEYSTGETGKDALDLLTILSMLHFSALPLRVFEHAWEGAKSVLRSKRHETSDYDVPQHLHMTRLHKIFRDARTRAKRSRPAKHPKAENMYHLGQQHVSQLPELCSVHMDKWNDSRLQAASVLLASLSLVTWHQSDEFDRLSMHPLAHAWAKDRLAKEQQERAWVSTGCILALIRLHSGTWRVYEGELRPHMQSFLSPGVETVLLYGSRMMMLPIVLGCGWIMDSMREDTSVEYLLKGIYRELRIVPSEPLEEHLPVWELAGSNLFSAGHIRQSVALMEYVVKVQEATLKETHPDRLVSQHDLANAYKDNGQVKKAVLLLEHVVKIQEATLKEIDPKRLASQHALACAYDEAGQTEKAIALLEYVVKVKGNILEETHPNRLASQHALATAYNRDGQTKKAIALLEHVVKVEENVLETHPDRLASQHVLATAYDEIGQTEKAIALLEYIVKVEENILGETHPSRLTSQHELAIAYEADGQTKKAIALLEHVVKIEENSLKKTHPSRLASQHELASAYNRDGQTKKAIALLEHVVKVKENILEETHPSRLASQHALASAYSVNGQTEKAIMLLEHIVKVEENIPETHPERLTSQHALASAYSENGQTEKAIMLLEHIVKVEENIPETHPDRLASQHVLAVAYRDSKQTKKAVALLEHVVKIEENTLKETDPSRLVSQHKLASAYEDDRQIMKAVVLMEHVVKMKQATMTETHPSRQRSERALSRMREEIDSRTT
ncbi:hypothetical protein N0V90_008747 [Kalmusia sp. IMI 367209]|nr:hypothetical protein N0V90_008747 [Kalmusia sp. IMI 367209]